MKILYAAAYPDCEFKKRFEAGMPLNQAAQKFNKLYIKGFCLNDLDVDVILFDNDIDQGVIKEEYNNKTITFFIQRPCGNFFQKQKIKKQHIRNVLKAYEKSDNCGIVVVDALSHMACALSKRA